MSLSFLCAIHCLLTPVIILSIPIMARYYLAHPWFHVILAFLIIPVGIFAFVRGYSHHKNSKVFLYGLPGLLIVGIAPLLIHRGVLDWNEPIAMVIGSSLLIWAHWINRKSCACDTHQH